VKSNGARKPPAPECAERRFAIVVARFYPEIADRLVEGAREALRDCNVAVDHISVYEVPGCFEVPVACRNLIDADRFDALVALGAVVRGETPHFDFVAGECARGIMDVQLETGVPIGFGILTTENLAQAEERADPRRGNKGYAAAIAAAALLSVNSNIPRAGFR
jgi:6,7-dimethyl-8-ribityllumazine synthase